MRLAPRVPKPKPSDSGKRKPQRRPFTHSSVAPQRSSESSSNQPFDSTSAPWGYGLASGIMTKLEVGDANDPLEPRLGVDLGRLRVHDDAAADELAGRINARAFTIGGDLFFRSGELKPSSQAGMRLLAHEVAHTLQSSGNAQTVHEAGGQPALDSTVMSFSEQFAAARRFGGQALVPPFHAPLKRSTPTLRRAPPETEQLSGEQPSVDYGEDFLEQSEKTQKLVQLTRHHLLNMIRDFTRPSARPSASCS